MSTDEPRSELSEADIERLAAARDLSISDLDRPPVLIIARFLQSAAVRLAAFEREADEACS